MAHNWVHRGQCGPSRRYPARGSATWLALDVSGTLSSHSHHNEKSPPAQWPHPTHVCHPMSWRPEPGAGLLHWNLGAGQVADGSLSSPFRFLGASSLIHALPPSLYHPLSLTNHTGYSERVGLQGGPHLLQAEGPCSQSPCHRPLLPIVALATSPHPSTFPAPQGAPFKGSASSGMFQGPMSAGRCRGCLWTPRRGGTASGQLDLFWRLHGAVGQGEPGLCRPRGLRDSRVLPRCLERTLHGGAARSPAPLPTEVLLVYKEHHVAY